MKFNDLTGKKFGRLKVLCRIENDKNNKVIWLCECDCGNKTKVISSLLVTGRVSSCGCLRNEKTIERSTKHGLCHTKPYKTRLNFIDRCYNKNNRDYPTYGGRGIVVCKEWLNKESGPEAFTNWALANGYSDNLTIDRIDVNGNYEPSNCRWVDMTIQASNRRTRKDNKSGVTGVRYNKSNNKWTAEIMINKKAFFLGYFADKEDAINARKKAQKELNFNGG